MPLPLPLPPPRTLLAVIAGVCLVVGSARAQPTSTSTETTTETARETETDPEAETETETETDPDPEADPEADLDPDPDPDLDPAATVSLSDMRADAPPTPWWQRVVSFLGLFVLVFLAWLMSSDRRRFPWRIAGWGLGLQLLFALFVLETAAGRMLFAFLNDVVVGLLAFTAEGSRFLFGDYLDEKFSFALNVLPTILFFSALMAILYHLGVMQRLVNLIALVMQRTMKTSGSETLSAAANIFVGQTEAPLVIKPYVSTMTRSELNAVMVGGFATVAGGVLAAYVGMLESVFPDIAGHLIAASVMSAPAALVIAKVMQPETESSQTAPSEDGAALKLEVKRLDANVLDAAARGATEGLKLAFNVAAMLLVFLALVALLDFVVGLPVMAYNGLTGSEAEVWSLRGILGGAFSPLAFVMGVPPEECGQVGALLGEKMVLNEFVAYTHLGEMLTAEGGPQLSQRSAIISTYALCGFANFGSIGIQIGGISAIAPERRSDLARLGLRAMLGGTLAACMTATVAGLLL